MQLAPGWEQVAERSEGLPKAKASSEPIAGEKATRLKAGSHRTEFKTMNFYKKSAD